MVGTGSPILLAGAIIVFETAFVAVGLIGTLPIIRTGPIMNIAIIAASALSALINISLAWGSALERSSWEEDYMKKIKEITDKHFSDEKEIPSREELKEVRELIKESKEEIKKLRRYAVGEFRRWEEDLKKYLEIDRFGPDAIHNLQHDDPHL